MTYIDIISAKIFIDSLNGFAFALLIKGMSSLSEQVNTSCKMQSQVKMINGTYKMVEKLLKEELA